MFAAAGLRGAGLALALWLLAGGLAPVACGRPAPPPAAAALTFPSPAGLNYGEPRTLAGEWLGTRWLRSPAGAADQWARARPAFERDLARIQERRLGRVIRIFIGLDQLMRWDAYQGYLGFDGPSTANLGEAFDMLDRHGIHALAVLYDQEETASPGNFHFQALDGDHPRMRAGYLRATEEFMRRFGGRPTVLGWDLFNEAYNSLGPDGRLPRPPAADPVSPGYPRPVVHAWLRDLYAAAKRGAPRAWLTVSDTTELYWHHPPDLTLYRDVVDFYDVHVYDDRPAYPPWRSVLGKPYIVGEAGASVAGHHLDDQAINSRALQYLLENARAAGVGTVLSQARSFTASGELTPTGQVVARFLSTSSAP